MHSLVEPDAWVVLRLPSGNLRVLQVAPNTTTSLGKYGSFPTNLIIQRPYNLTYELLDKRPDEKFNRLRIVPAAELYADVLSSDANTQTADDATPAPDTEGDDGTPTTGVEYTLVDSDSGVVVASTDSVEIDASARQTLTLAEIEALKKDGTDAGRELITRLMLSHTAIEQKTEYSLAKYKLLKTRKYIRRFCVLPLDIPMLNYWHLEDKDASKIMEMREEMIALVGCWANVHFGGSDPCEAQPIAKIKQEGEDTNMEEPEAEAVQTSSPGRWIVVDDTGGLLVAAMAERMGILYPSEADKLAREQRAAKSSGSKPGESSGTQQPAAKDGEGPAQHPVKQNDDVEAKREHEEEATLQKPSKVAHKRPSEHRREDAIPYAHANTITHIHPNSQPNLSFLRYYDFEITNLNPSPHHPLAKHLMTLSWLQLLDPDLDPTYSSPPPNVTQEEIYSWKTNRRSTFHRKRKRWMRTRHIVDTTRRGEFSGLVVASTMDPVSIMRHTVPLLAGGAPIAIYSPTIEPLTELADCYSLSRRAAWATNIPEEVVGKTPEEQEQWPGNEDFPLNPSLVLGASIQTSRVRKWQVLPGRTHPLMSSKGGAEGYVFTAWKVKPAEGKVEARGKLRSRKRKAGEPGVV